MLRGAERKADRLLYTQTLVKQSVRPGLDVEITSITLHRYLKRGRPGVDQRLRCRGQRAAYHAGTRFNNACFFAGDIQQRRAQFVGMFELDTGDAAYNRLDNIAGVQPSAQTDLDNGVIHLFLLKQQQCHSGEGIKKCGRIIRISAAQCLNARCYRLHQLSETGFADGLARYPKTLGPVLQVRRAEHPNTITGSGQ